jgi:hypothetical protein
VTARLAYSPAEKKPNSPKPVNKFGPEGTIPRTMREWKVYFQEIAYAEAMAAKPKPIPSLADLAAEVQNAVDKKELAERREWLEQFKQSAPEEYVRRLSQMSPAIQRQRLEAIRERTKIDHIGWLTRSVEAPLLVTNIAEENADAEALRQWRANGQKLDENGQWVFPMDPTSQKARDRRKHSRSLRRALTDTDLFLSAACGAISRVIGTPYASDFTLARHRANLKAKVEVLKGLRLVRRDKPEVQLSALEMSEKSARANRQTLRTLIDIEAFRGRQNGMWLCWVTLTLPGRCVPRAIDEEGRVEAWDPDCDFRTSDKYLQKNWAQIRAILAKHNIELSGTWAPQAQHSGTQHRHLAFWVHSIEDAEQACDVLRDKHGASDKNSRAVAAFVIGHPDKAYAPPPRKDDGAAETVESVFQYMSRYSTRDIKTVDVDTDDKAEVNILRHQAIASDRFRSFAFFGMRPGAKARFATCWRVAARGGEGICPRTTAAVRHMRRAEEHQKRCGKLRSEINEIETTLGKAAESRRALLIEIKDELVAELQLARKLATRRAYFAALCLGHWRVMCGTEERWLFKKFGTAPEPLSAHEARENRYGEVVKKYVGITTTYVGIDDSGVPPLMPHTLHEWMMLDAEEAAALAPAQTLDDKTASTAVEARIATTEGQLDCCMAEDPEKIEAAFRRAVSAIPLRYERTSVVTLISTDPRPGPSALPERAAVPPEPPPNDALAA